jgi:diaminopimelate decarboxylase
MRDSSFNEESSFQYKKGELFCEDASISQIADEIGTPLYLYSHRALVSNYKRLRKAFRRLSPLICYSLKANANLTLSRILAKLGAGADILSGGELYKALLAGFPPKKIVFAGVGKTRQELEFALREDIFMVNVESQGELELLEELSRKFDGKTRVSLRINPDIDPKTHPYITTGVRENKFGLEMNEAEKLYLKLKDSRNIVPKGIHFHLGSQITRIEPYLRCIEKMGKFISHLRKQRVDLEYMNMGGGFGIAYREGESPLDIEELASRIAPFIQERGLKLIMEPGRYLVGNTGIMVTQILYRKRRKGKKFLIVDAGMNDLMRPALYGAYHEIKKIQQPKEASPMEVVDVVGPVCESTDFLAKDRSLPQSQQGEYLATMDAGAYGFSMASSYNARLLPPEILVKGEKWILTRRREVYSDLTKTEDTSLEEENLTASYPLPFVKLQGSGNDFIVVDNRVNLIKDRRSLAMKLCPRKTGIGADGLLLLEESQRADFKMRIFNPDGSEAEMCGNGARCIARFAYLKGIVGRKCRFETLAGIISCRIQGKKVKIGTEKPQDLCLNLRLSLKGEIYEGHYLNTGVPHFVLFTSRVDLAPLRELGPSIRNHPKFRPQGANVDFVEVQKGNTLKVRTYERGVEEETLACGTGAVASALTSNLTCGIPSPVRVKMKGGDLWVYFERAKDNSFSEVFLEGEAHLIFEGKISEEVENV